MTPASPEEAKSLNLKHYFSNKPCRIGHIGKRMLSGECVQCQHVRAAKWREKNREKERARFSRWRDANCDHERLRRRNWNTSNPEKRKAQRAKWAADNPEKIRASRRRRAKKNKIWLRPQNRARWNRWARQNKHKVNAIRHAYRARKAAATGSWTKEDINRIFAAQRGRCAYCRKRLMKSVSIDHIIALSKGGTNEPRNIQLVCKSCNSAKKDKDPISFAQQAGCLL